MTGSGNLRAWVIALSDTRKVSNDTSGDYLAQALQSLGHSVQRREIIPDELYSARALFAQGIAAPDTDLIVSTGGTGFSQRDITPEAVRPLLDKEVEGFGEIFRQVSIKEIGVATIQSRALAGLANQTLVVCLPGSLNACKTAWESILREQLDAATRPCNFAELLLGQR